MDVPSIQHARYRLHAVLGKGASGIVVLAKDVENARPVAIKLLERGPQVNDYTEREAFTHRLLNHPHVVKMKELFLTQRYLGIVLEYANLGDLFQYVTSRTRLTENQARWFFQQLMVSVDYLHRRMEIAHRDIKLENILLSGAAAQPILKLCDFDMAPEVLLQRQYDGKLADVWSCGVVLYTMLAGRYPFTQPGESNLPALERQKLQLQRMVSTDAVMPSDVILSSGCLDLLQRMLQRDPARRVGSLQVLQHPWVRINMPDGVLSMNDRMAVAEAHKGDEELRAILQEARAVGMDAGSDGGQVQMTYVLHGAALADT